MPVLTEKRKAIECIKAMPDSSTLDEVIENLYLIYKIQTGIKQADAGECISHEEVVKRFEKRWLK